MAGGQRIYQDIKVHFKVFEYNLQDILSINVHLVSVGIVGKVIKGKKP